MVQTPPGAADASAKAAAAPAPEAEAAAAKKPRRSKRLKRAQAAERGATKASLRIVRAVEAALSDYDRRAKKSAGRKRDGVIKDAVRNWVRASTKASRKALRAPEDFLDGVEGVLGKRKAYRIWWPRS